MSGTRTAWEEWAAARSAGELVEVANVINDLARYRTVEDCARDVIPAVARLLEDFGIRLEAPDER
jgi:hypothetical protein